MNAVAIRPRRAATPIRPAGASAAVHSAGVVLERNGDRLSIRTGRGPLEARCAASCLLEPEPGDRVLVSGESPADCYVIAVLERAGTQPQRLRLHGDTCLAVNGGTLSVVAEEGLELSAGKTVKISGTELEASASSARLIFGRLAGIGRSWLATVDKLGVVGQAVETVTRKLSLRAEQSFREVEQIDQLRSGQIDHRASGNLSLRGRNTLLTAKELVKLDGDQIHLG